MTRTPGLVSGDVGGWWAVEMTCTSFGRFLLGGSNVEKLGDHRKNNFFINDSAEALLLLEEGHQGLLKLHVHLDDRVDIGRGGQGKVGVGSSVGKNGALKFGLKWKNKV